jgi:hypothetical protein
MQQPSGSEHVEGDRAHSGSIRPECDPSGSADMVQFGTADVESSLEAEPCHVRYGRRAAIKKIADP